MKAEILRELGQFAEALALLNRPFSSNFAQAVAIIEDCAKRGDPFVKKIAFD